MTFHKVKAFSLSTVGVLLLAAPSFAQITPQNLKHYFIPELAGNPPVVQAQDTASQREMIMAIQRHLKTLGFYTMAIDGVPGPGTWRAVDRFYGIAGVSRDGFGPNEFTILERAARLYVDGEMDPAGAVRSAADPSLIAAKVAQQRAIEAYQNQRYEEAEELKTAAIVTFERLLGPDHLDTLRAKDALALALRDIGRFPEAEVLLRELQPILDRVLGAEHQGTLNNRNSLANVISAQGMYAEANALYRETLGRQEQVLGREHPSTLDTMNNLATLLVDQGRYEEAEILHRRTLAARDRVLGQDHPDTLISKGNLAVAISSQGRLAESEELNRELLADRVRVLGKEHRDTLATKHNLGVVILDQNRPAEAESLFRAVLALRTKVLGAEHPETLQIKGNLAGALALQDRKADAEALLRELLEVHNSILGAEHPVTLRTRYNIGLILESRGLYVEAEEILRDVLSMQSRIMDADHPDRLNTQSNLAGTVYQKGRIQESFQIGEEVLSHVPAVFERTGSVPSFLEEFLTVAWEQSDISGHGLAARTLPVQGYISYGDLDIALGDAAARTQMRDGATAEILRIYQDAREEMQERRRAYLASFETGIPVTDVALDRIEADMNLADARFREVADRIARDFPSLAELELPRALSAEEAQALLEPGEGLLAYASTEDHLYAWLVAQERIAWYRMDAPRADLNERVAHLRASLDLEAATSDVLPAPGCALHGGSEWMADRPFDLCAARDLHEIVLGEIDLSGIDELIVVPNGPLESLPFALLVADREADGRPHWLIKNHAITTLPTTSSLRALRHGGDTTSDDDRLPFLGFAPVEFDAAAPDSALRGTPLAALPGTADEIRLLSGMLGGGRDGTVIGAEASETFVKSAPLDRYRVLSFATHGLLSREAAEVTGGAIREMALALRPGDGEDGFLTASEVAGLRLDADWVLLSACNTAGGDGDDAQGLSGLARAFFFAGARALMVSHWPIDDAVTPALMADTMARSAGRDASGRAQALRQAQLAMLSQRQHAHPFYWAPFSVVGDNR